MFQFPPFRLLTLCIEVRIPEVYSGGFPHWEIPGSKPAYGSPRLIAVNHVLLRLLVPRHPPYTLFNLTVSLYNGRSFFLLPFYLIIKEHKQSLVYSRWYLVKNLVIVISFQFNTVSGIQSLVVSSRQETCEQQFFRLDTRYSRLDTISVVYSFQFLDFKVFSWQFLVFS